PVRTHPLAALTEDEVRAAVAAVRATGRLDDAARFATISLQEPTKAELAAFEQGETIARRVHLEIVPGPDCQVVHAVVEVSGSDEAAKVRTWDVHEDVRPALLVEEAFNAIVALHENQEWIDALAKRGIHDLDKVQVDPWPTGNFGIVAEEGRRVVRCIAYYRETPGANGYARPIEGLLARVDAARGEVVDVTDLGVEPLPGDAGSSYYPEDNQPLRSDLRPVEITQPDGPSFSVDGNVIRWQHWTLRVTLDPHEGLVLHGVAYDGRPILHRASICEMVVPYGDPGPMHGWKNAFDAGEWGLGRMANSLAQGCDCLGEIRYLDAVTADEQGNPVTMPQVICLHEEDYGILWKHQDMHSGRIEVRRSRRLVVSSIATVGNYEYGFYWYLYLDGTLQHEVKLTGIMSTQAGEPSPHAKAIAPGLAAPLHQHLFCARLDLDVDGTANAIHEVDVEPLPSGPANPWGNAFVTRETRLETEHQARRNVDPARSRTWRITSTSRRNQLDQPTGYKLVPAATPRLLADPDSSIGRRAGFALHNLWVTPYEPGERRAAGDHPNQHPGGDGLPRWTEADRSLVDADLVVWHTFGVTHIPRPEDWPVMPVEYTGFQLIPVGFFDRNPALDVPSPDHCG
ncbi:MAG TPA: primary-amine oxidase, partial [Acidimicrobiales bacterium]